MRTEFVCLVVSLDRLLVAGKNDVLENEFMWHEPGKGYELSMLPQSRWEG